MFLQVPFPQGCRSHSSISAGKKTLLTERLRAAVLEGRAESAQPDAQCHCGFAAWQYEDTVALPLAVHGTTQQVLEKAHVHREMQFAQKGSTELGWPH